MLDLDAIEKTLAKSPKTLDTDVIERLVEELRQKRLWAQAWKLCAKENARLADVHAIERDTVADQLDEAQEELGAMLRDAVDRQPEDVKELAAKNMRLLFKIAVQKVDLEELEDLRAVAHAGESLLVDAPEAVNHLVCAQILSDKLEAWRTKNNK